MDSKIRKMLDEENFLTESDAISKQVCKVCKKRVSDIYSRLKIYKDFAVCWKCFKIT